MTPDQLLERLDVARQGALAAGADDVEVSYEGRVRGFVRFADSRTTGAGEIEEQRVRTLVRVGARVATHTVQGLDASTLREAGRGACALARAQPGGLPSERPPSPPSNLARGQTRALARHLDAEARAKLVDRAVEAAARVGATGSGLVLSGPRRVAVLADRTSSGCHHEVSETTVSVSWRRNDASSYCVWHGRDAEALDAGALFRTPLEALERGRTQGDPPLGRVDVVLAPPAVAELLEWLAMASFSGRTFVDGSSCLHERQGQMLMSPQITLRDYPAYPHPSNVPWPFDAEGRVRQAVTFVDAGRAGAPVTDAASAASLGHAKSTGHAAPLGTESGMSPLPRNVVLEPGSASLDDLVRSVDRGLFVTRLHYVNGLLDTRRALTTGTTRDGVFAIRDGQLGEAVRDVRFNQSLLEAFTDVIGVGDTLASVPTTWTEAGAILCPHVALRGFRITARARAED